MLAVESKQQHHVSSTRTQLFEVVCLEHRVISTVDVVACTACMMEQCP